MASGGKCENVSEELLEVSVGECPGPCADEVQSSTRIVGLTAESIESVRNEEEKVVKILSKKEEKKKVPRHRRFWESSDCSCSKEVFYFTPENMAEFLLRFLKRVIGKMVRSPGKELQGNSK